MTIQERVFKVTEKACVLNSFLKIFSLNKHISISTPRHKEIMKSVVLSIVSGLWRLIHLCLLPSLPEAGRVVTAKGGASPSVMLCSSDCVISQNTATQFLVNSPWHLLLEIHYRNKEKRIKRTQVISSSISPEKCSGI